MAYKKPPRRRVSISDWEPSETQQQFRDECNISLAVNRWLKHGIEPKRLRENPLFADVSELTSYSDAIDAAVVAREMFMTLDSRTRKLMDNNPQVMLDVLQRNDLSELVSYGLMELHRPEPSPAEQGGTQVPPAPQGAQGSGA